MGSADDPAVDDAEHADEEWPSSSFVVIGPQVASAERGDGTTGCYASEMPSSSVRPVSPASGDSAATTSEPVVDPADVVPTLESTELLLHGSKQAAAAVDAKRQQQQPQRGASSPLMSIFGGRRGDIDVGSAGRMASSSSNDKDDDEEVFESTGNDRRSAVDRDAKAVQATTTPTRTFSLKGLRKIFPGGGSSAAAKPDACEAAGPAKVEADDGEPSSGGGATATDVVETASGRSVRRARRSVDVELSWASVADWYFGWFELPWLSYVVVAVAFSLAAVATEADPALVVLSVLMASVSLFLVCPPTSPPSPGSPCAPNPAAN